MVNFKGFLTCGRVVAFALAVTFSSIVGCSGEPEKVASGPSSGAAAVAEPAAGGGIPAGPKGAAPRVPRGPGQLKALQESVEKK